MCLLCLVSLERGRGRLDHEERELLREVRELRKKLAARARSADYTLYSASSHHSQRPGQQYQASDLGEIHEDRE